MSGALAFGMDVVTGRGFGVCVGCRGEVVVMVAESATGREADAIEVLALAPDLAEAVAKRLVQAAHSARVAAKRNQGLSEGGPVGTGSRRGGGSGGLA